MTTYGFIGLGHQGTPMAERMIATGFDTWLWARRDEVLDRYRDTDAHIASSPADLGARCDVIGLCLYDADATDAVLFGDDGLASTLRPGTIVALHATVAPSYAIDLAARLGELGVHVVDAPVSGTDEDAAARGALMVIVGGADDDIAACRSMFDTYSNNVRVVGPVGAAQATKLINNVLMTAITGLVFDANEMGLAFSIDPDGLADVLSGGSAANPSVRIHQQLGGAETFSIRAWPTLHKDVALARAELGARSIELPLLLRTAETTIDEMVRLRATWVAERESSNGGATT